MNFYIAILLRALAVVALVWLTQMGLMTFFYTADIFWISLAACGPMMFFALWWLARQVLDEPRRMHFTDYDLADDVPF